MILWKSAKALWLIQLYLIFNYIENKKNTSNPTKNPAQESFKFRIFFRGDHHIDNLCHNHETVPNRSIEY